MTTAYERLLETPDGKNALCVEQTITNVTELLCRLLDDHHTSRSELAKRIGVTPGRITQLLDGRANLTLKSVARALAAFDCVLEVNSRPVDQMNSQCVWHLHGTQDSRLNYVRTGDIGIVPRNLFEASWDLSKAG